MHKALVAAFMLIVVSALPASAQFNWTKASPGGGGSFQSVDVADDGKVLVGSDLSGAYLRSGTGTWTRLGKSQGIEATAVVAVRWKPGMPSLDALIGTKNGLYRTTDGGGTWMRVSAYTPRFVSAIAWKGQVIYVAGAEDSKTSPLILYTSIDDGVSWNEVNHGITSDLNNVRRAVKLAIDASDNLWLLSGNDGYRPGKKELYRSTTGGSGMVLMHGTSLYPIDVAPHPTIANRVLMTASNSATSGGADGQGVVYSSTTAAPATPVWASATIQNNSTTTGAVWWEGNDDAYMVNVYDDACPPEEFNSFKRSGKFHGTSSDWGQGSTWEKIDNGRGGLPGTAAWDAGWSSCEGARGRALSTVAKTLSARGEYWVTSQFVWRYNSAPAKYENAFAAQLTSNPATWITKGIDNTNPRVFTATGTGIGNYFAGYYDLGLWRTTSDGARWENVNPVQLPEWQGTGGNVTGIVTDGAWTWATMGPSNNVDASGHYRYRLWRSSDTGASWSPQTSGNGLPDSSFMHGLSRDASSGGLWVTANGQLYRSTTTFGVAWNAVTGGGLPTDGLYVTQSKNTVVLVGGTHGLYRSTGPAYTSWTKVGDDAFDFRNEIGDDEVWTDNLNSTIHDALHKIRWPGIHQILFDPFTASRVWVVSYFRNATPPAGKRIGIWKSDDNGVTFAPVMEQVLRRGVAVDWGGGRLHITSGAASTAGSNDAAEMTAAQGKQTCIADGSGNFPPANCTTDAIHADYPYPFGGPIEIPECGKIFVGVPGHGFMRQDLSCGGGGGGCEEPPCEIETERPGGFGVKLTAEEAKAAETKGLKLYDLAGRRVQVYRPGVYFDGITHRRIVIVQK